jgi:hypothetical protein
MHPEDVREYGYVAAVRSGSASTTPCTATTHLPVARVLHRLLHAPRLLIVRIALTLLCLCHASRRVVSPLDLSSVAPLVVDYSASRRLVVDYSASRRLVVDYFTSATRPGALARRAARHAARRATRRRLLRLA